MDAAAAAKDDDDDGGDCKEGEGRGFAEAALESHNGSAKRW